jgi:carbon monoxide dehydrogenase subunit G
MTVSVDIDVAYEFAVKATFAKVFALLSDVPASVSHFPHVERLVDMGDGVYRWEMEPVGTAHVHIQTVYASKYVSNKAQGTVVWTPVPGIGNAQVGGSWTIVKQKGGTALTLDIQGTVVTPAPAVTALVVEPVVRAEFERLIETYIDNLIEALGGEV